MTNHAPVTVLHLNDAPCSKVDARTEFTEKALAAPDVVRYIPAHSWGVAKR